MWMPFLFFVVSYSTCRVIWKDNFAGVNSSRSVLNKLGGAYSATPAWKGEQANAGFWRVLEGGLFLVDGQARVLGACTKTYLSVLLLGF